MRKQIAIAAGDIADDAVSFLLTHGATIDGILIDLPASARVERGSYYWQYTIGWYGPDGNDESQYLEVELDIDAYDTRIRLRGEPEEQCEEWSNPDDAFVEF